MAKLTEDLVAQLVESERYWKKQGSPGGGSVDTSNNASMKKGKNQKGAGA